MPVLFNVNEAARMLGGITPWTLRKQHPMAAAPFSFFDQHKEELT